MNKYYELKNRIGSFRKHSFVLDYDYNSADYTVEMKDLWRRVIEQAKDEYIQYKYSRDLKERVLHYNARDFLFDDNYRFKFGSSNVNLAELLDLFNIDIDWVRLGIRKQEEDINGDGDYQPGSQLPLF